MYDRPKYPIPGNQPCAHCGHRAAKHRFVYGVVDTKGAYNDRYRCEAKTPEGNTCNCGEDMLPKSFRIPAKYQYLTETDSGRRQLIEMISAGEINEEYVPKFGPR
jgi:hypothetical protein